MSEPRWDDAGTRPPTRDTPGPFGGPSTRHGRVSAGHGRQARAERSPRWGELPARRGIVLVVSGAAIGTVITVLAGGEPGFVLGFFLVIATLAASFAVRPGAVYRIIPAPALAYLAGAVIAGLIHDGGSDTSGAALAISAAQWIADGFLAMTIATALAVLIGAIRWGTYWRRAGAVGPRVPVSPRSAASPRTTDGLGQPSGPGKTGGPGSTGSTGGSRRAGGLPSPHGLRAAGGPRGAGSARTPRSAGGPGARHTPAGPRASTSGDDRGPNTPPRPSL